MTRLAAIPAGVDPPGLFAPAGEAILWIAALDDLLRRSDPTYEVRRAVDPGGALLPGIRYARNALTHGNTVAAVAFLRPGSQPGMMVLGVSQLGTLSRFEWMECSHIGHTPRKTRTSASEARCFDHHLAGNGLIGSLTSAFDFLRREAGT